MTLKEERETQPSSTDLDDLFDDVMSSPVPERPQPTGDSVPSDSSDDRIDPIDEHDESSEPAIAAAADTPPQPTAASPAPVATPPKPAPPKPTPVSPAKPTPVSASPTPAKQKKPPKPKQSKSSAGRRSFIPNIEFSPKLLIPIGIGLIFVLSMYIPWGSGVDKEHYMTLIGFRDEFRELRERKASPAEWKSLEDKVLSATEPMIVDLEKRGGARNRISQHMLFAARDFLPGMFRTAQAKPDEQEQQFDEHMENTRELMGDDSLPP